MIAIFGGTFNPVHLGHINMAKQCVAELKLSRLYFMPCALPAHKTAPEISTEHRLAMLATAIAPYPQFALDLREIKRQGASYSLLSVQELNAQYPDQPIIFLIGMDSFNSLDRWYQWQQLTDLCHIVVYQRPGQSCKLSATLSDYVQRAKTADPDALQHSCGGKLYFLAGSLHPAASSEIRREIKKNNNKSELLPESVSHYIAQHKLYQSGD